MRSSGAASTSGSITHQWTGSTRSSPLGCPMFPSSCPARSARSSEAFAGSSSTSCPGSPRRSTGHARWSRWDKPNSPKPRSSRRWAPSSSTRRISNGCGARARASSSPAPSMPDPGVALTRNWLHFGQILRGLGFDAGPARMLPFLRTLTVIDLGRPDDVRSAVHAHFGRRRDELPILDRALVAFLRADARAAGGSASAEAERERGEPLTLTGRQLRVLDGGGEDEGAEDQGGASYSRAEVLREKDFDTLTEAEMAEVRRLIRMMRLPARDR